MKQLNFAILVLVGTTATVFSGNTYACEKGTQCYTQAEAFFKVSSAIQLSKCAEPGVGAAVYPSQFSQVATDASKGSIDLNSFIAAYSSSCDFYASYEVSKNKKVAENFVELYGANFTCDPDNVGDVPHSSITAGRALWVAGAAARGTVSVKDFIAAYKSSCDYDASYAVAVCQNATSSKSQVKTGARDPRISTAKLAKTITHSSAQKSGGENQDTQTSANASGEKI